MKPYVVYINEGTLAFAPRTGTQRDLVVQFIRSLGENPFQSGDFSEHDDAGRALQVKLVGRYAVTFWADHAVSEVKVTHIKPADQ